MRLPRETSARRDGVNINEAEAVLEMLMHPQQGERQKSTRGAVNTALMAAAVGFIDHREEVIGRPITEAEGLLEFARVLIEMVALVPKARAQRDALIARANQH